MITDITINGVASYKQPATLHTDKIVNLIYGLNGSGKSTLSEFLRHRDDTSYVQCGLSPEINEDEEEILVYNDKYVRDVFYEKDSINGIFSLSKENADAYKKIEDAQKEIQIQLNKRSILNEEKTKKDDELKENRRTLDEIIWDIKKTYSGGDRVLKFCLEGYMSSKTWLADYLRGLPKPEADLSETIEDLKREMTSLNNSEGLSPIPELPLYSYLTLSEEDSKLLKDVITGDKNSRVAALIDRLSASDWVKRGLEYDSPDVCPFCQRPYKDDPILKELKEFFNEDYKRAVGRLEEIYQFVKSQRDAIVSYESKYDEVLCLQALKPQYSSAFAKYKAVIDQIVNVVLDKVHNPGKSVSLPEVSSSLQELNKVIETSNEQIVLFNHKVETIQEQREKIKIKFWTKMRWQYDTAIATFDRQEKAYNTYLETTYDVKNQEINKNLEIYTKIVQDETQKIVNITEAIIHINAMLVDMGITDFRIEESNTEEGFYRIARTSDDGFVFKTLSEGEKVIISFLYFLESCRGLQRKTDTKKKRIIVIDDPISSLSHIYIFNVARLVQQTFFPIFKHENNKLKIKKPLNFEQVFVLTHSLYFFYELVEKNVEYRSESQAFFRIKKAANGSSICEMKYGEVLNEYQAYWAIINDPNQHIALIANCMRNVLDYFFGFVENIALNNIFQKPALQDTRFHAFNRYMNRESHSDAQNILDMKEFDRDAFQEAFKAVFKETDYMEHYNKMRKITLG